MDRETKKSYLMHSERVEIKSFTPMVITLERPSYRNLILPAMKLNEVTGKATIATEDPEVLKQFRLRLSLSRKKNGKVIWSRECDRLTGNEIPFTFMNRDLDCGHYVIRGELSGRSGNPIGAAACHLRKAPPAKEEIWIEKDTIMINGDPFFPIGFYAVPIDTLKEIADAGANFVWYSSSHNSLEGTLRFADEAAKHGMKIWSSAGHSLIGARGYPGKGKVIPGKKPPAVLEQLSEEQLVWIENKMREEIPKLKDHPALLCWWSYEESFLKPEVAARVARIYRDMDPYHPLATTHNNGNAAGRYRDSYEIFAIWSYPRFYIQKDTEDIAQVSARLQSVWKNCGQNKCVLIGPSTHIIGRWARRTDFSQRRPNYREIRNETYQGIINGAKGMIYIKYKSTSTGSMYSAPGMWHGIKHIIRELKALVPVIVSGDRADTVKVEGGGGDLQILAKKYGGHWYVFAVNASPRRQRVRLAFEDAGVERLRVISEDRSVDVKDGRLLDSFEKFETHIYTTSAKDLGLEDTTTIETECRQLQREFREKHRANLASDFLGSVTKPRYGAMIDNDEFSYAYPAISFSDIFKLPFPIDVIFREPQAIGKVVLKVKHASGRDFEIHYFDSAKNGWIAIPRPRMTEITRQSTAAKESIVVIAYEFTRVRTAKLRVVLSNRRTVLCEIEAYGQ